MLGISLVIVWRSEVRDAEEMEHAIRKLGKSINPSKVEFIPPLNEEAEAFAIVVQENDKRGKDTKLDEL